MPASTTTPAIMALAVGMLNAAEPEPRQVEFFEKRVRPVLAERCYECHSAEKKQKGGLALDTREATMKGGDSGQAIIPGEPDRSRLIEAVRYANRDMQMPPKKKLPDSEIQALEEWVRMGAPDPRTGAPAAKHGRVIDIAEGRRFWSFAPLARVEVPEIRDPRSEIRNPVDAFIRAKLHENGLSPAPPADRRTLIRRATFDLTGLPPTPEEVDAFLADRSPDAFGRVIERLLSSPHYGERWARHWLDVARYADSNGMDENVAYGNAWRYRDYVVRAFNQDKPFDQFLVEQVAGDLLPRNEEAMTATAFLALGAKVLAEPDMQKLEMDIIDEQIDTVGKAFLGVTLGCARCHEHKFDPVTQEDYYAMAAIFRGTRSLAEEKRGAIKFWHEHSTATPEQLAAKKKFDDDLKAKKAEVAAFIKQAREEKRAALQRSAAEYLAAAALLPAGAKLSDAAALAKAANLDARYVLSVRQHLDGASASELFAKWRELEKQRDADGIRTHYAPLFTSALAERQGPAWEALSNAKGFLALPAKDPEALDAAIVATIEAMNQAVEEFTGKQPELPALMGVADGTVVTALPVHIRGSYLTLGRPVERGFPEVMRTSLATPVFPAKQSGRLEFARWMASGDHPLTARVLVNRVWRWHFGAGIVTSTDNFGVLGARPSHPELLDWLARSFIEGGWSVKALHRLIMTSETYQQASTSPASGPDAADPQLVDPGNRLVWRANIQRLEAEQIRDAMLATSGWLDRTMGGKTIPLRNREFVFNHTSKDATTYESPRRALYLPIIRNHLYDMLEQFDYPDPTMPTGSRNSTVIAPQALIMLNAPVVAESARRLAGRLASLPDDPRRIDHAYSLLFGRPPAWHEKADALALLRDFSAAEGGERALALLCQTLYAANEFIYLR